MAPAVSDDTRDRFQAALAAALLLMYQGTARRTLDAKGLIDRSAAASPAAKARITAFAADRAAKVQRGINTRIDAALADVPAGTDPTPAVTQAANEIHQYSSGPLLAFYASWATHQALIDTYRDITSADGTPLADSVQWEWAQNTDYVDDCTDAAAASPAPLADLLDITGGPPPTHERCQCTLSPV